MHGGVEMAAVHVKRRQLRVARRAPQVHHHVLGDAPRQRLATLLGDQVKRDVDPCRDPRARGDRTIDDEDAIVDDVRPRREDAKHLQQLVVRRAAALAQQSGPRGEQRPRADRHQPVGRAWVEERVMELIAQPSSGGLDLGRDLLHVNGRLTDHDDPRRRRELLRQRHEIVERQSDRCRHRGHRSRERETKARRQSTTLAMLVGQTKGFSRSGDVEQQ